MAATAPPRRRRRLLFASAVALGLVCVGLGVAAFLASSRWPAGRLVRDDRALARLVRPSFGSSLERVRATEAGRPLPVRVDAGGRIWPRRLVTQGARVSVEVVFRRPRSVGWLVGRRQRLRLALRAPVARLGARWLEVPKAAPVAASFAQPVAAVAVRRAGKTRRLQLAAPARHAVVVPAAGRPPVGAVQVEAAPRTWERLSPPAKLTWFPAAPLPSLRASPRAGATIAPTRPLRLLFSRPVAALFGEHRPRLEPATPGRWLEPDAHTLEFVPAGLGFPLGKSVRLVLPRRVSVVGHGAAQTLRYRVPPASTLRLQQLLAQLGYLPLDWQPSGAPVPRTPAAETRAAIAPPQGAFRWRYPNVPATLEALWHPGGDDQITRGAVIAFQSDHDLEVDGIAGPKVWRALLADALAGRGTDAGYSYVVVRRSVPQTLTLWHDGETILTARVNTGVPRAPTELGTFPVYLRLATQTMSGVNPDGSHYSDPGIRWISYFNGGDAIHGFNRASYGYPQSVGCVELPVDTAARVWPYTTLGTLVTVVP